MPDFKLNKVIAREVELTLSFDDETLELAYYPNHMTLDVSEQFAAAGESSEQTLKALVPLLSRWNITNGSGKALPITYENLRKLPARLNTAILRAVMEDMFPNARTTEDSGSF